VAAGLTAVLAAQQGGTSDRPVRGRRHRAGAQVLPAPVVPVVARVVTGWVVAAALAPRVALAVPVVGVDFSAAPVVLEVRAPMRLLTVVRAVEGVPVVR